MPKAVVKLSKKQNEQDIQYEKYWTSEQISDGLEKDLIKGSLRINNRNFKEAYVTHPKLDSDIFIYGQNINRALFDDIVVVQIFPKSCWKVNSEFLDECSEICSDLNIPNGQKQQKNNITTLENLLKIYPQVLTEKLKWNIDLSQLHLNSDFPTSCNNWWKYFQRTGRVIGILTKLNSRMCVGKLSPPLQQAKTVKFSPIDIKYPRIDIPIEKCPKDYLERPDDFKDVKFIAEIGEWDYTDSRPTGTISQCMGDMSLIDQEMTKILVESGVYGDDKFDESILMSLNETCLNCGEGPHLDSQLDYKYRRDFRPKKIRQASLVENLEYGEDDADYCVFSIDPKTARDLDDALHIRKLSDKLENGTAIWEVGVHIADVTHYVTDGSLVDQEASNRCTTVYLVHKAIPMLPRKLCENLCSLTPGTDKMTFSVVFHVSEEAEILDTWFGKSIIHSAYQLNYEEAQDILDNSEGTNEEKCKFGTIYGGATVTTVSESVIQLNKLAQKMRQQRFDNGCVSINNPKIGFILDEERSTPIGFNKYVLSDSNHLIEEWMLRANMSVADYLYEHLPDSAFLRCHCAPTDQAIDNINNQLNRLGLSHLELETGSGKELMDRLESVEMEPSSYLILVNIFSKAMQLAFYMCSNNNGELVADNRKGAFHFALNVPFYTHFTSPIRRYADIIVHRQLISVLIKMEENKLNETEDRSLRSYREEKIEWLTKYSLAKTTTTGQLGVFSLRCNKRKKDAKTAEEASAALFYLLFVDKSGPFTEDALVLGVLDKAFEVLLTETGFVRRIYIDQLDLAFHRFSSKKKYLTLIWKTSVKCQEAGHQQPTTIISCGANIDVIVSTDNKDKQILPKIKYTLPMPVCNICEKRSASNKRPSNIGEFESLVTLDDNQLYSVLDNL